MPLTEEKRNGLIQAAANSLKQGLKLKPFQCQCLNSIIENHMTVSSALTGMGKSYVFLSGLKLLQSLSNSGEMLGVISPSKSGQVSRRKVLLLVLPFLSLAAGTMADIENSMPTILVAHIDTQESAAEIYDKALAGKLDIVITTPEMLSGKIVNDLFSPDSDKVKMFCSTNITLSFSI